MQQIISSTKHDCWLNTFRSEVSVPFFESRSAAALVIPRAVANGATNGARPPIWNLCPPISRLTPWLLHTSNTVFLKRGPPSGFWPPCCCILATGLVIPYTSRPPVFHCCPDTKKFCGKVINRLFVVRKLGMVVCEVKFWNITYFQIIITRTKGWRPESKDTKSYE